MAGENTVRSVAQDDEILASMGLRERKKTDTPAENCGVGA